MIELSFFVGVPGGMFAGMLLGVAADRALAAVSSFWR